MTQNVDNSLKRLRNICAHLPETTEKLSHGEPTFFVKKKVYAMFANNHHGDGHIAVWIPAPEGAQEMLIASAPKKFFRPPYVGVKGWVGIELAEVSDTELEAHIREAWRLIAPRTVLAAYDENLPTTIPNRKRTAKTSTAERKPKAK